MVASRSPRSAWQRLQEVIRSRTVRMSLKKTQWHNVVAWRGLADIAEKYIHKGDKVIVLGTIQYREYEKDGVKRYATDILAYDLILCGKAPDNGSSRPPVTAADMPSPSDYPPMLQQTDDLPF